MLYTSLVSLCQVGALCAITVLIAGCQERAQRDDDRPEMQAYVAELGKWKRDSAIIDSLSRLIPSDSLLRLRRAALSAGTDRPYRQAMLCEYMRWTSRHGSRPAEMAFDRLDSALTPAERS